MGNIWIISDTHFRHKNIIRYCDRPFSSVTEMNEQLISKWNAKVSKEDIVIHLGDFSCGSIGEIRNIRNRLNGNIILIKGNHDRDTIKECGFLVIEGNLRIGNLILSHEPMQEVPIGFVNVHGHIHHRDSYWGINVSVEKTNYEPVELSILEEKYGRKD